MVIPFLLFLFGLHPVLLLAHVFHGFGRMLQVFLLFRFGLAEPAAKGSTVLIQIGQQLLRSRIGFQTGQGLLPVSQ